MVPLRRPILLAAAACLVLLVHQGGGQQLHAYVEIPYALGRIVAESSSIAVLRVEKVDRDKNLIFYRKVQDLKGKTPDQVKHNIARAGFHPREWQIVMQWAEPGKTAVFFYQGGASETCIHNYWYQAYAGGEWWNMSHAEPFLLRSFAGKPERLAVAVSQMLAGQEVVVPCMVDGNKNDLQLRTARIQRMRASLKLMDYNPKRDFVGWGGEEEMRPLAGMPGFTHLGGLGRTDPGALGVTAADFDSDGKLDFCLYGEGRVAVFQNAGQTFNEVPLPYSGGARSASWGDFNGDKKLDLLLATPTGPRLLANTGSGFRDETTALPPEPYWNLSAATFVDFTGDGHSDILLANGFQGLKLYRNKGAIPTPANPKIVLGKWHLIGPFDNPNRRGFDIVYPPEKEIDLQKSYFGKNDAKAAWRSVDFPDGQPGNLLGHFRMNQWVVAYLYREIESPGVVDLPVSLGSDDTLTVWLNGQRVLAVNEYRAVAPDQNQVTLRLRPGKNQLLLKICQGDGDWGFYFAARMPPPPIPLRFDEVTAPAGLASVSLEAGKSRQLIVADFNGDGRQDCLATCGEGMLLLNTGNGFRPAAATGLRCTGGRLAPLVADVNGDGLPDVLVVDPAGCKLFLNEGQGRFRDSTPPALANPLPHLAAASWCDPDGDGKLDLFLAFSRGTNRFLRNDNGTFRDASTELGLHQRVFNTRSVLVADLNHDGAPDVVLNNEGQDSVVLIGNPAVFGKKSASPGAGPPGWPTYRGDPQRTGAPDNQPGPKTPRVEWVYRASEHHLAAPVPGEKHVYVSGLGAFNTAVVRALSLETAAKERIAWAKTTPALRLPVVSSPAVLNGMLIFGDGMHQTDGAVLHCLSSEDGFPLWQLSLPGQLVHLEGGPTVAESRVFMGGGNAGVFCVDLNRVYVGDAEMDLAKAATIRRERWRQLEAEYAAAKKKDPDFAVPPSPDMLPPCRPKLLWQQGKDKWHVDAPVNVAGEFLLVASAYLEDEKVGDRALYCLRKSNGEVVWRQPLRHNPWAGTTIMGNVVLVGTSSIRLDPKFAKQARGEVQAFDLKSGKPLWQREYRGGIVSPIAGRMELAVFTCTDGRVRALEAATGTPHWSSDPFAPFFAGPAVTSEGVYVADVDGVVHALNLVDGSKRWTLDLASDPSVKRPGMVFASPVLHGGRLYLATTNHEGKHAGSGTAVVCISDQTGAQQGK